MRSKVARRLAYYEHAAERARNAGQPEKAAPHEQAAEALRAELRYQHRCDRCGRYLETEISRAKGIGPDCAARLKGSVVA